MNTPLGYGLFTRQALRNAQYGGDIVGTPYRMFVLQAAAAGASHPTTTPGDGGAVDGVGTPAATGVTASSYPACRGWPVLVEAGGIFSAGDALQTDVFGRAILRTTGAVVLRALETSTGAGVVVQAVFT